MQEEHIAPVAETAGRTRAVFRGANPPTQFYILLRRHCDQAYAFEQSSEPLGIRFAASELGLSKSMYHRMQIFIRAHDTVVEQAMATGDWSSVENILFGRFGPGFRTFASFRRAMAAIAAGEGGKAPSKVRKRKGPKPTTAEQARPENPATVALTVPPTLPSTQEPDPTIATKPVESPKAPRPIPEQDDLFADMPAGKKAKAIATEQHRLF